MDLAALRAQLEAAEAADNGAPAARRRHVDAAIVLFVALVDDLEDAEADDLLAMMIPLVTHDARLEIQTRRRLATELTRIAAHDRARAQLTTAHARATEHGLVDLAAEIEVPKADSARIVSSTSQLAQSAERVSDPDLASKMERALAQQAGGAEAIAHARKSLEHARETVDPQTVADATSFLCELLADAGDLAEAKALLEERPLTRDSRADRALYDEIRRRLGEPVADPPEEPDQPIVLPLHLGAYFTKPHNVPQSIVDGALPSLLEMQEWAAGTITSAADLDSEKIFGPTRSFWCSCGRFRGREYAGMTCHRCGVEIVHKSTRRTRVGVILLERPAIHPWFAQAATALVETFDGVADLRAKLDALDLEALAAKLKQEVVTAPKAKVADQAGRRLAIVDAFRKHPCSPIIEAVLVLPPDAPNFDHAKVHAAYVALLEGGRVEGVFDAIGTRRH